LPGWASQQPGSKPALQFEPEMDVAALPPPMPQDFKGGSWSTTITAARVDARRARQVSDDGRMKPLLGPGARGQGTVASRRELRVLARVEVFGSVFVEDLVPVLSGDAGGSTGAACTPSRMAFFRRLVIDAGT